MGGATMSLVGVGLTAVGAFILVAGLDGGSRSTWLRVLSAMFIVAGVVLFIAGVVR
jgi:hypothetical protein